MNELFHPSFRVLGDGVYLHNKTPRIDRKIGLWHTKRTITPGNTAGVAVQMSFTAGTTAFLLVNPYNSEVSFNLLPDLFLMKNNQSPTPSDAMLSRIPGGLFAFVVIDSPTDQYWTAYEDFVGTAELYEFGGIAFM